MSKNINRVLIVSEAGRLRDSLRVLLKSCYPLAAIAETETCASALQRLAADPNALVLVDAALPGEQAWQALDWFRAPCARCVLLAHSLAQQKQAREARANAILLDGLTAESFLAVMAVETQGC
jgi:DNA-binding NarL/FixJ family response regulator